MCCTSLLLDSPKQAKRAVRTWNARWWHVPGRRASGSLAQLHGSLCAGFAPGDDAGADSFFRACRDGLAVGDERGRVHPLRDAAGNICGVQLLFWDVTARVRAERLRDQERQWLQTLLDNMPDSIYFKDPDSRFIRVGAGMAKKFGLPNSDAVIGLSDADIFTPEHAKPAREDELAIVDGYSVNVLLSGAGGSMQAALTMMQAGAAIVHRCSTPQSQVVMVPPPELPVIPTCFGSTSSRVSR
jgi:PAS domain-containing protein